MNKLLPLVAFSIILLVPAGTFDAFAIPPGTLYGATGGDSDADFYELIPADPDTFIGDTSVGLSGIEFDSDGTLYAAGPAAGGGANFGTIDPTDATFTQISTTLECTDIAIDPIDGTLYCQKQSNLYSVVKTTGVQTLLGSTGISETKGSAMDIASDGTMYYGNQVGLYSLNKVNGAAVLVDTWTFPTEIVDPSNCRPSAFDFDLSGTLWASLICGSGISFLVTINTVTAEMTFVENTVNPMDAIAFLPEQDGVVCPPGTHGIPPNCIPDSTAVGGTMIPIDTTALLLAGAQINAVWIMSALAVIGSVAFGALYITSKKN